MAIHTYVAEVGERHVAFLATESRTAFLASDYRPEDLGGGRIALSPRALSASREIGEEDGYLPQDTEGLRVWIDEEASELVEVLDG